MAINVLLLRQSFARIPQENGGVEAFGLRFYERLFEKYPAVKPLFTTSPQVQYKKLIAAIAMIVGAVDKNDGLVPYLQALAIRHQGYKVQEEHYAAVGENLLETLKEHLSVEGQFDDELKQNWLQAYQVISQVMIAAARQPDACNESLREAGYRPDGTRIDGRNPWESPIAVTG